MYGDKSAFLYLKSFIPLGPKNANNLRSSNIYLQTILLLANYFNTLILVSDSDNIPGNPPRRLERNYIVYRKGTY